MSLYAVTNHTNIYNVHPKSDRKPGGELGKDDFLKLLVAQMQNQDPLSPMDDREIITQMAQFSLIEQMKVLNESFMASTAFQLIGRKVYAEVYDKNTGATNPVQGTVDRVFLKDGEVFLGIGDKQVSLSDVSEVSGS